MKRKPKKPKAGVGVSEWVGGTVTAPMYVTGEGTPYRPDFSIWLQMPEGMILGAAVTKPGENQPAIQVLHQALQKPLIGNPRRPARIRVADQDLASDVRKVLGEDTRIVVAPTPELMDVAAAMERDMPRPDSEVEEPSYFAGGRVSAGALADLFRAARVLWTLQPWKHMDDDDILRVDIPDLDVDGACVCIIGALGESFGLVIFPSLDGYDAFLGAADRREAGSRGGAPVSPSEPVDIGTTSLSLNFEPASALPPEMRKEVASNGWEVAGHKAYPVVAHVDRDAMARPLEERDVAIVTACALALGSFFLRHGSRLGDSSADDPICESYFDNNHGEVRLTYPAADFHDLDDQGDLDDPDDLHEGPKLIFPDSADIDHDTPVARSTVGRNQPCPCGSGLKHKKCCLGKPSAQSLQSPGQHWYQMDQRLGDQILEWARHRFPGAIPGAFDEYPRDELPEDPLQMLIPWLTHDRAFDGDKTLVTAYLEHRGHKLLPAERGWLQAQQRAHLSLWEVTDVHPGTGITLLDLLTGQTCTTTDIKGSHSAQKHQVLLARIVEHDGMFLFAGLCPQPLLPLEGARVVATARNVLDVPKQVDARTLKRPGAALQLLQIWSDMLDEIYDRPPPILRNSDGEDVVMVEDEYSMRADDVRTTIEQRLRKQKDIDPPVPGQKPPHYVLLNRPLKGAHDDPGAQMIGRIRVLKKTVRIEANSLPRADRLRARFEDLLGDCLRFVRRKQQQPDPAALGLQDPDAGDDQNELTGPEADAILQNFKKKHYAGWVNDSLPALSGLTPHEAAASPRHRGELVMLLKDMEAQEAACPPGQRFDFGPIRKKLGL